MSSHTTTNRLPSSGRSSSTSELASGEWLAGTRVAGFELVRLISGGSAASLYEGKQGGVRAAVKIHRATLVGQLERNERELKAQQQISHPCVARTLASDRLTDGSFVLVSEWIEGTSLEARLRRGPLAWRDVVPILRDLARGLGATHAAGIVHRDIKPSNVMLPSGGKPAAILVDFGHALLVNEARLTGSGLVLGSAHYMAPEQAQGIALDHRADLYATGVVLYRMLTGILPFDHVSPAEVMRQHQQEPVRLASARGRVLAPPAALDLCLWLMTKDRDLRVPNAHVLRLTLEAIDGAGLARTTEEHTA